jgi:hypothetical protein
MSQKIRDESCEIVVTNHMGFLNMCMVISYISSREAKKPKKYSSLCNVESVNTSVFCILQQGTILFVVSSFILDHIHSSLM